MVCRHAGFDAAGAGVVHLGEEVHERRLRLVGSVEHLVRTMLAVFRHEALKVRPRHEQVDIVVPGDEALVADCAEQGPVGKRITQAVFHAHRMENIQNILLRIPQLDLQTVHVRFPPSSVFCRFSLSRSVRF